MDQTNTTRSAEGAPSTTPRSRKESRALGVPAYFTGMPCKHGHIAARHTQTYECAVCAVLSRQSRLATIVQSVARDMGGEMHREWAEMLARDLEADAWRRVATLRDAEGARLETPRMPSVPPRQAPTLRGG